VLSKLYTIEVIDIVSRREVQLITFVLPCNMYTDECAVVVFETSTIVSI